MPTNTPLYRKKPTATLKPYGHKVALHYVLHDGSLELPLHYTSYDDFCNLSAPQKLLRYQESQSLIAFSFTLITHYYNFVGIILSAFLGYLGS